MKIKSSNTFKVKRNKFLQNCENIWLKMEKHDGGLRGCKAYGTKEGSLYGSNNYLAVKLHDDIAELSLDSYGGMCGFEFDTDKIFPFKATMPGEVYDLQMMLDVKLLLEGCVKEVME